MDVVQEVQQIFGHILPIEFAKMIKEKWSQCMMEWVWMNGWMVFWKEFQKGAASESEDECSLQYPIAN